jgi:hypothetical protein
MLRFLSHKVKSELPKSGKPKTNRLKETRQPDEQIKTKNQHSGDIFLPTSETKGVNAATGRSIVAPRKIEMDAKASQRWFSVKENKLCRIFSKMSKKKAQEAWMKDSLKDIQTQLSDLRRKSDDLEKELEQSIDGASPEERNLYKATQCYLAASILAISNIALDVDGLEKDIKNQEVMDSFFNRLLMLNKKIMSAYDHLALTGIKLHLLNNEVKLLRPLFLLKRD